MATILYNNITVWYNVWIKYFSFGFILFVDDMILSFKHNRWPHLNVERWKNDTNLKAKSFKVINIYFLLFTLFVPQTNWKTKKNLSYLPRLLPLSIIVANFDIFFYSTLRALPTNIKGQDEYLVFFNFLYCYKKK